MVNKNNIDLMSGYDVHIQLMAELGTVVSCPFVHFVKVPKDVLEGKENLPCLLFYPLDKDYEISIKLEKDDGDKNVILYVEPILMAIALAYQKLAKNGCLRNHDLSDLYIERLELVDGDYLVVYVGS